MRGADDAHVSQINDLIKRLAVSDSIIEKLPPGRQAMQVATRAFQDIERAHSHYRDMSAGAQQALAEQMQPLVERSLYYGRAIARQFSASPRDATGGHIDEARIQLDHARHFALSVLREPDKYCAKETRRESAHRFDRLLLDTLGSVLAVKIDGTANDMAFLREELLQAHPPEEMMAPMADVSRWVFTANRSMVELNEREDRSPQIRLDACNRIWSELEKMGNSADRFMMQAAKHLRAEEAASSLWMRALAFVDAVSAFDVAMSDALDVMRDGASDALSRQAPPATEEDWAVAVQNPPRPVADKQPAKASRSRSRPVRKTGAADAPAVPAPSRIAAEEAHKLTLKKAASALASSPRLSADMAANLLGDPLALARELQKDTSVVDLMRSDGHDPLSIAFTLRGCADRWFGNAASLANIQRELTAWIAANAGDEKAGRMLARLNERIEAVAIVARGLDVAEADLLKQHEFPKAAHLERLLKLDQIDRVLPPSRLKSEGDEGGLGTLFELQITPRPLSDGSKAPTVYLHLHTDQLISKADCLTLPFDKFTAAHVKNEEQKGFGALHVQMQRHYGNNIRIHRGPVDEPLLNALRDRVGK